MQLGMIGLGRMGANLVRRLMRDGHECVVYDVSPDAVKQLEGEGAVGATSLEEFVAKLTAPARRLDHGSGRGRRLDPRPARPLMADGDIIIDGGNSYYRDDIARAARLKPKGIHYVDVGTSGGVFGLERGFCLMIGGEDDVVEHLEPIFATHRARRRRRAAHARAAPATPNTAEHGYLHCGPNGAGPLREDGAQRHRVRDDGRVRRGPQRPAQRRTRARCSAPRTPRPRRCASPSSTSTTSTSPRSPRCGGAAASSPRGCSTSPPPRSRRSADLAGFERPRLRLRRGSLDGAGRDRRGRARAGAHRGALRALRLRGATPTSPTSCSRRCARSSAATSRRQG